MFGTGGVVGAHGTGVFFNKFCKLPRLIVSGRTRFTVTVILVSVPFPFPPSPPQTQLQTPRPFFCSLIPRLFRFPIWRWRWTGLAQLPRTFLAVDLLKGGENVFIRNAYGRYRMVRKFILPLSTNLLNNIWASLSYACVQISPISLVAHGKVPFPPSTKEIGDVFTQAILFSYCLSFIVCNHALNSRGHFVS